MNEDENIYRQFTMNEVATMTGRLTLHSIAYYCQVGTHKSPADMIAITKDGIPIFVCIQCATTLIGLKTKRNLKGVKRNGRKNTARKANGNARKAASV
jgi:hypothetical protein